MTKLEMVNEMVANGYTLFNETAEQFANRFDENAITIFFNSFMKWKEN